MAIESGSLLPNIVVLANEGPYGSAWMVAGGRGHRDGRAFPPISTY